MEFNQARLNRFYQYCFSLTLHEQDAYDLLQSGIEKFLKHPPATSAAEEPFLYRIIRNRFIDQYRHQQRFESEPYDDEQHSVDFDISTLESIFIDNRTLNKLMAELSTVEREILFLWAVEEYTTQEVADLMSIPKGTVLSRIFRLRKKLQNNCDESDVVVGGMGQ